MKSGWSAQLAGCFLPMALAILGTISLPAQDDPGSSLGKLVRGNEVLGRKLLLELQARQPDRNTVIAALPVTLMLAAIQSQSDNEQTQQELGAAFGWGGYPHISVASRMLVAAFEVPERQSNATASKNQRVNQRRLTVESAWISNSIAYQTANAGRPPFSARFINVATKDFGVKFLPVKTNPVAQKFADLKVNTPELNGHENVLFRSTMHVRMIWEGNTFSMSVPHPGDFQPEHGAKSKVEMQDSELRQYNYRKTDRFEAVELPCYSGTMTVVLPIEGKSVHDVEAALLSEMDKGSVAYQRRVGVVTMPTFHLHAEQNVQAPLEEIGVKEIFQDLGTIASVPKSRVKEFKQSVDLLVNREGIQGDSESVAGLVIGGLMSAPEPFYLKLNRPFVFLIRERETGALTYAGAVMDASQQ